MESRETRLADNEALFRAMNQRMADWHALIAAPAERQLLLCECADLACHERVHLTMPEYTAVRARPTRFAVLPGRVEPDIEHVTEAHHGYVVVEKRARLRDVTE